MSGYRGEPDEAEGFGSMFELRTFSALLIGPALVGLFFLFDGLATGGRFEAGFGVLWLASAPFVARWAWRGGMWD